VSILAPVEITCPTCALEFQGKETADTRGDQTAALRDQILSGTLNRYRCPRCSCEVRLEPALLYADFERGEVMAMLPDHALRWRDDLTPHIERMFEVNLEIACPPLVKSWAPHIERRLVFGLPRAQEKLRVWAAGLDDRVVEHLKMQALLARGLLHQTGPGADLTFEARVDDDLRFVWLGPSRGIGAPVEARFEMSLVDYLRCRSANRPAEFTGALVDWRVLVTPTEPMPETARAGLPLAPAPLPGR
jgi:hypothetical protein